MEESEIFDMGARHPIGVVAERTGLSPDVLRMWERRYGAVRPARQGGGHRLYSDADIERLSLLRRATRAGRSIGTVASLTLADLTLLANEDGEARATRALREADHLAADRSLDVQKAVNLTRQHDGAGLEAHLRRAATNLGAAPFLERVSAPYLRRLGEEWHAGRLSPGQEHMGTETVRRVVYGVMADLAATSESPLIVVAGPAGDRHDLGGMLVAATASAEGWRVLYLGSDLPAKDISQAALASEARVVGVSVVFVDDDVRVAGEITRIRQLLPATVLMVVGGAGAESIADQLSGDGIRVVPNLAALRVLLGELGSEEMSQR